MTESFGSHYPAPDTCVTLTVTNGCKEIANLKIKQISNQIMLKVKKKYYESAG